MYQDPVGRLQQEIAELKSRLKVLEELHAAEISSAPAAAPPIIQSTETLATPPPQPAATLPPFRMQPVSHTIEQEPVRNSDTDLEEEIGGNWLNKIGAVALVLGMAFFLKYAIDNRWIDETGRVVIGILVGLGCIFGAEYFRKRDFKRYAQGLCGAGIAILYFSVYSAFGFYHLIGSLPAFAFMVVVTVCAVVLSLHYDSIAIAVLGIIGGFLTPILMDTNSIGGVSEEAKLLSYIAILDLGILALTRYKDWRGLNLLSLFGTLLIFVGWGAENYDANLLGPTMAFLTLFFLIFAAQAFVHNVSIRRRIEGLDVFLAALPPVIYYLASSFLLADRYESYLGLFTVLIAAVYIILAQWIHRVWLEDKSLGLTFLSIATGFLIIAIPVQLNGLAVIVGWAIEALAIAIIGIYMNSTKMRTLALTLLALVVVLAVFWQRSGYHPFQNQQFAVRLLVVAIVAIFAALYSWFKDRMQPSDTSTFTTLTIAANLLFIWFVSAELVAQPAVPYRFESDLSIALSAFWAFYAVASILCGMTFRYAPIRQLGVGLLLIVILKTFLYDVWSLERVYRIIAFITLGIVLFLASFLYNKYRDRIRGFIHETGETNEQA